MTTTADTTTEAEPRVEPPGFDAPLVRTQLPGPRSAELLERQAAHESNARSYPRNLPIAIKRALGSYVEDLDGNVFIDFLAGAGSLPLGHSHPEVVEAVQRQLPLLAMALDFPTEPKDAFTTTQLDHLPAAMRARTRIQYCGPTGANAVDAALKLCKTATGRGDVVAFHGAFHGSSHSALTLTGLVSQKAPIANTMPGVHFFPYPSTTHCSLGGDPETLGERCLEYFERSLKDPLGGLALPAAVILEVVQGEAGAVVAPKDFVQGVRRVTHELDIPLIVDEVPVRLGEDGNLVGLRAVRHRARCHPRVESDRGHRHADRRHPRRRTARRLGAGRAQRHIPREPARIRRRESRLPGSWSETACWQNVRELGRHALDVFEELERDEEIVCDARGRGLLLGVEIADPRRAR